MSAFRLPLFFVLVICCSSMAIAQNAKLVKKAEWGSGIYENIVEISDHYYIETSSHQIDVINPSLTGQESLVGQITLAGESQLNIVSIGRFKDHLVVATETKLSIYSIINTTELTLMFSTSINAVESNAIEVDDNRLYYVDSNNDIFIIQETDGEFNLLDTIHSKRDDQNLYTYERYLAVNGSELLYLSHQSISGTLSITIEKYNTTEFSLIDTATLSDHSMQSAIYVGEGRFVTFESGDISLSLISSSAGSINILNTFDDIANIGAVELAFQNKQLKALSWERSLYSFEITDDNKITLSATENLNSYLSDVSALNSFSVLNNKFIGLSTQDGLFEIKFENGNFVDVEFTYNQSGFMGDAIVKDDLLYSPRGQRIDVMNIAELKNIKFGRKVMIPADNIQRNGDTFIISNSNTLSNYSLSDNFNFNSSVDVTRPPKIVGAGEYLYTIVENDTYKLHRYNNDNPLALYDTPTIIEFQSIEYICPNHLEVVNNKLLAFDFCGGNQIHLFNGIGDETFDYAKLIKHDFSYSNVATMAEYIYFIDNSGITTVKFKDTDELEEVSSLNVGFEFGVPMQSAEVIDDYLLVYYTNELYLFSLTTPSTPTLISKTIMPNRKVQGSSIQLEGGYILVTNTYEGQVSFFEINKAPTANINSVTLNEDQSSIPEVIFTDPEDDELTFTIVESALNGTAKVDELGLLYTPKENFYGQDSIIIMAEDEHGNSTEQELAITVKSVNDAPFITTSTLIADEDINLITNIEAEDVEGDELSFAITVEPINGTATISSDGELHYLANANFNGTDSITFSVKDPEEDTNVKVVSLIVNSVNDLPTLDTIFFEMDEDSELSEQLIARDIDGDSTTFSYVDESSSNGVVAVSSNGDFTFSPLDNFNGEATFTVKVKDSEGAEVDYLITINVNAVDDIPTAVNISETVAHNGSVSGELPTADVDGEILTYTVISDAKNGTLTLSSNGAYTYTADTDFSGSDLITYEVTDENNNAVQATISFSVQVKPEVESSGGTINYLALLILLSLSSFRRLNYHRQN